MNENKPILFINSPVANLKEAKSQYVYDSRIKNDKIIKNVIKTNDDVKIETAPLNDINEKSEIDEKLINKINLLHKRAQVGHFVSIEIEKNQTFIEGEFKEKIDEGNIVIYSEGQELTIPVNSIDNIRILKV